MKLTIDAKELKRGLNTVSRAVARRSTLPITGHILVSTEGTTHVRLVATNLEIAISCWLKATSIGEEGALTVPAMLFSDFVGSLPDGMAELSVGPKGKSMLIKCGRSEARINGQEADEFPPVPKITEGLSTKINALALRAAIGKTAIAANNEDSRPVLTGVNAQFDGTTLTLAGADGFRLAVHKVALSSSVGGAKVSVIIPSKSLVELARLLSGEPEDGEVSIRMNPQLSQVLFRLPSVEMVSQLLQGTYPNYTQLIPQQRTMKATLSVPEFLAAVRAAALFARDDASIVRFVFTPAAAGAPGKLAVTASAAEIGDNMCEIDAEIEGGETGGEIKIAFNSRYLLDLLNVIGGEKLTIETTTSSSPGLFKPVGDDNYLHVIMPMFVQW